MIRSKHITGSTLVDEPDLEPVDRVPYVAVIAGRSTGVRVALAADDVTVGRGSGCTLVLVDPSVSRRHAQLVRSPLGVLALVDLRSSNGCFVNGRRVEHSTLHDGDIITFGTTARARVGFATPDEAAGLKAHSDGPLLTERQLEVATHMVRGLGNATIAAALGISRRTVTTHVDGIFERLGVGSRLELLRLLLGHHEIS